MSGPNGSVGTTGKEWTSEEISNAGLVHCRFVYLFHNHDQTDALYQTAATVTRGWIEIGNLSQTNYHSDSV